MRVMDQSIHDGVAEGGIADAFVPVFDGDLAREERRATARAVLDHFQEIPMFAVADHRTNTAVRLVGFRQKGWPDSTGMPGRFAPEYATYDADARTCVCPAGKSLCRKGASNVTNGLVGEHFRGAKRDCAPCALRAQCLRTPETTVVRNVAFFRGREDAEAETHTMRMQQRLETPEGREQYGRRFATVEPVFANVRYNPRLDRFMLRGRTKVNGQWPLFCLVHNTETLAHAGYAA